jgi:uncharacterized protein (DUF924 family)
MPGATAHDVLAFWFSDAAKPNWFARSDAFDAAVREGLLPLHERAATGELDVWAEAADGALALVLLLDQVPRNVFRGHPRAFATDAKGREIAWAAIGAGLDWQLVGDERRTFLYLPLEHSEDVDDQRACVRLFEERVTDPMSVDFARRHLAVVERFGRFPHRNAILGRETTAAEAAFLSEPGSSF